MAGMRPTIRGLSVAFLIFLSILLLVLAGEGAKTLSIKRFHSRVTAGRGHPDRPATVKTTHRGLGKRDRLSNVVYMTLPWNPSNMAIASEASVQITPAAFLAHEEVVDTPEASDKEIEIPSNTVKAPVFVYLTTTVYQPYSQDGLSVDHAIANAYASNSFTSATTAVQDKTVLFAAEAPALKAVVSNFIPANVISGLTTALPVTTGMQYITVGAITPYLTGHGNLANNIASTILGAASALQTAASEGGDAVSSKLAQFLSTLGDFLPDNALATSNGALSQVGAGLSTIAAGLTQSLSGATIAPPGTSTVINNAFPTMPFGLGLLPAGSTSPVSCPGGCGFHASSITASGAGTISTFSPCLIPAPLTITETATFLSTFHETCTVTIVSTSLVGVPIPASTATVTISAACLASQTSLPSISSSTGSVALISSVLISSAGPSVICPGGQLARRQLDCASLSTTIIRTSSLPSAAMASSITITSLISSTTLGLVSSLISSSRTSSASLSAMSVSILSSQASSQVVLTSSNSHLSSHISQLPTPATSVSSATSLSQFHTSPTISSVSITLSSSPASITLNPTSAVSGLASIVSSLINGATSLIGGPLLSSVISDADSVVSNLAVGITALPSDLNSIVAGAGSDISSIAAVVTSVVGNVGSAVIPGASSAVGAVVNPVLSDISNAVAQASGIVGALTNPSASSSCNGQGLLGGINCLVDSVQSAVVTVVSEVTVIAAGITQVLQPQQTGATAASAQVVSDVTVVANGVTSVVGGIIGNGIVNLGLGALNGGLFGRAEATAAPDHHSASELDLGKHRAEEVIVTIDVTHFVSDAGFKSTPQALASEADDSKKRTIFVNQDAKYDLSRTRKQPTFRITTTLNQMRTLTRIAMVTTTISRSGMDAISEAVLQSPAKNGSVFQSQRSSLTSTASTTFSGPQTSRVSRKARRIDVFEGLSMFCDTYPSDEACEYLWSEEGSNEDEVVDV